MEWVEGAMLVMQARFECRDPRSHIERVKGEDRGRRKGKTSSAKAKQAGANTC
jgi:hypothetical protein